MSLRTVIIHITYSQDIPIYRIFAQHVFKFPSTTCLSPSLHCAWIKFVLFVDFCFGYPFPFLVYLFQSESAQKCQNKSNIHLIHRIRFSVGYTHFGDHGPRHKLLNWNLQFFCEDHNLTFDVYNSLHAHIKSFHPELVPHLTSGSQESRCQPSHESSVAEPMDCSVTESSVAVSSVEASTIMSSCHAIHFG